MSVTNGVAGRVEVPVVAVPDGWRERDHDDRPVVVGVESGTTSAGVVAVALEEAARRESRALMVHAWMYSEAFDREVFAGEFGKQEHLRIAATLTRQLASLTGAVPDGQASLTVEHGRAAEVLVAQAQGAQLLVVGRHHPRFRLGSHLGPVTRAVLGHAPCPVMVVPVTSDQPDVDRPARVDRG
jgi:nucleotide-binding universal stress UspA family protein